MNLNNAFTKLSLSEVKPEVVAGSQAEDMDWSDFIFSQSATDPCVSAIVFLTLIRY